MSDCCAVNAQGMAVGVSLVSGNSALTIGVTGTGTKRTITLTVSGTGFFLLDMWLIDDATEPGVESLVVPSDTGATRWKEVAKTSGSSSVFSFDIDHSGAAKTWYLAASLGGKITVSTALAFT